MPLFARTRVWVGTVLHYQHLVLVDVVFSRSAPDHSEARYVATRSAINNTVK